MQDRQNILNDQSSGDEEEFNITGGKDMRASKKDKDVRDKRPSMPPQFVQTTEMTPLVKVGMKKNSI